jgi:hypothetical protein
VVQGYHAASGRPLALKVYNRARLDTMERFQVCCGLSCCGYWAVGGVVALG